MSKTREVSAFIHKAMPACCRKSVMVFAAGDRYMGAGEPGDRIRCGCGNVIVYGEGRVMGWRVAHRVEADSGAVWEDDDA